SEEGQKPADGCLEQRRRKRNREAKGQNNKQTKPVIVKIREGAAETCKQKIKTINKPRSWKRLVAQ
ncbi:hypothetical protein Tsubulata_016931, partial [Turnera subulata]